MLKPKFWAFLFVFLISQPIFVLIDDVQTYYANVNNTQSCCGYVDSNWLKRPFTHLKVDWTEPAWKTNYVGSEVWLVSEGKVDGTTHFWTIWDKLHLDELNRKPIIEKGQLIWPEL